MNDLILHCGDRAASLEEIALIPTSNPTESHYPIPHGKLIGEVRRQLLDANIQIQDEAYDLSHEGARTLGVLALKAEHLPTVKDSDL